MKNVTLETKTLEVLRMAIMHGLSPEIANQTEIMVQRGYHIADGIMSRITVKLPAEEIMETKFESSGWQLFKKRWFPKFLLKRYPIKYDIVKIYFLHPEIKTRPDDGKLYYAVRKIATESN